MGSMIKKVEWVNNYLHNMPVNSHVRVAEVPVKDKELFVEIAKEYINIFGDVEFNANYTRIRKMTPMPKAA